MKKIILLLILSMTSAIAVETPSEQLESSDIKALYQSGSATFDFATFQANMAVGAVFLASYLTGGQQIVAHGTLTQFAPNLLSFNYTPTPTDKLIVVLLQGVPIEYSFTDFRGNFTSDAANFLSRDHALSFKGKQTGGGDIELTSYQMNGQRQGRISGNATIEKVSYQFDLGVSGTYHFENDSTGSEYKSDFVLKGTVESPRIKVGVDESRSFQMITTRNRATSKTESTSNAINVFNSSGVTTDGHQYLFQNGLIKKSFRDGKPSEGDYWKGQGVLLKDGQSIGEIELGYQTERAIIWFAFSAAREKIELESWQLWDPRRP